MRERISAKNEMETGSMWATICFWIMWLEATNSTGGTPGSSFLVKVTSRFQVAGTSNAPNITLRMISFNFQPFLLQNDWRQKRAWKSAFQDVYLLSFQRRKDNVSG
jgi:hypothetical protein